MVAIANDNISRSVADLIPPKFQDNNEFLDIISWNIRWFNDSDPKRVARITEILGSLNADIFVFQEIRNNSLDVVARRLSELGAGDYKVMYGTTGGDQRVAIMYDFEWVKLKDDIHELFGKGQIRIPATGEGRGKDAFPRLPLWGYFTARSVEADKRGFDFQLAGVHLKSQMGTDAGKPQRTVAANALANWLTNEAADLDADVIVIGDWNAAPDQPEWNTIHQLEQQGDLLFQQINDHTDFSHLYYKNRNHIGSRLDLALVSSEAGAQLRGQAETVRWVTLDELLESNPNIDAIKAYIKQIKEELSDHMPIYTRYYSEAAPTA
jgi:endonuclease/exonuclease/phosphatase family metal-dependent hydrolase